MALLWPLSAQLSHMSLHMTMCLGSWGPRMTSSCVSAWTSNLIARGYEHTHAMCSCAWKLNCCKCTNAAACLICLGLCDSRSAGQHNNAEHSVVEAKPWQRTVNAMACCSIKILLCTPEYPCVPLHEPVYPCVPLDTPVYPYMSV